MSMSTDMNERPFLLVGDAPCLDSESSLGLSLDLILAQPGRWQSEWYGHMVSRVSTSGDASKAMVWATSRKLTIGRYELSDETPSFTPWGALLISKEERHLEVALHCVRRASLALSTQIWR